MRDPVRPDQMHAKEPPDRLTLHRGLSVPADQADDIVSEIRSYGLPDLQRSTYRIQITNLRDHLPHLLAKAELTISDTRPEAPSHDVICACGDRAGAVFYARRGRPDAVPILVTFTSEIHRIYVDGRDALYTIFTDGAQHGDAAQISAIWGDAITPYLRRAWSSASRTEAIACCNLAIQDIDVVRAHCRNATIIAGRYQTRFASAFFVEVPVPPSNISAVESFPSDGVGQSSVSLASLLGRSTTGRSAD